MTEEGVQRIASSAAHERFFLEELQVNLHTKMGREVLATGHTMSMVPTSAISTESSKINQMASNILKIKQADRYNQRRNATHAQIF